MILLEKRSGSTMPMIAFRRCRCAIGWNVSAGKQEACGSLHLSPGVSDGVPAEAVSERQQQSAALSAAALLNECPSRSRTCEVTKRQRDWLLANLLDWHRRESKADWWEYFRLKDLTDEELLDERSAMSGLEFDGTIEVQGKIPTDRYHFEKQETTFGRRDVVCERGEKIGEVVAIDIGGADDRHQEDEENCRSASDSRFSWTGEVPRTMCWRTHCSG